MLAQVYGIIIVAIITKDAVSSLADPVCDSSEDRALVSSYFCRKRDAMQYLQPEENHNCIAIAWKTDPQLMIPTTTRKNNEVHSQLRTWVTNTILLPRDNPTLSELDSCRH